MIIDDAINKAILKVGAAINQIEEPEGSKTDSMTSDERVSVKLSNRINILNPIFLM